MNSLEQYVKEKATFMPNSSRGLKNHLAGNAAAKKKKIAHMNFSFPVFQVHFTSYSSKAGISVHFKTVYRGQNNNTADSTFAFYRATRVRIFGIP